MHQHSRGNRFIVFDDVLEANQLPIAQALFTPSQMTPTVSPINRFRDGFAYKGPGPLDYLGANDLDNPHNDLITRLAAICIDALYPNAKTDSQRWRYSCTYMAYTAGTQLSWHEDSDGHDAVFNYYLDTWHGDWGGELDLIDCDPTEVPVEGNISRPEALDPPITITSVFPRANRMTVMYAKTLHRVRRVDALAGSHLRRAISGSVALV